MKMYTYTEDDLVVMISKLHTYKFGFRTANIGKIYSDEYLDNFCICPLCYTIYEKNQSCQCDNDE